MRPTDRIARVLSIAGLITLPQIALADDEIRANIDVSPTIGYASNPFTETKSSTDDSGLGSAYAEIDLDPQVRLITEHSLFSLSGRFNLQHYFHIYSNADDYEGALDYSGRPTARLTTHARISYDSAIAGGLNSTDSVVDLTEPSTTTTSVIGSDLALYGTETRRRLIRLSGDAGYTLSERGSLTTSAYYDQYRYSNLSPQSNYNGYGASVGYSRKMSGHLQLGVQTSVDLTDYQGVYGHSQVYSLQATINNSFSSRWNLNGAVGASYAHRTVGGTSLSPTGNLRLCRVGPRSTLCAIVSEYVQSTGFTGTAPSQSVGASYTYRLSARSDLDLNANFTHNKQTAAVASVDNVIGATSYFSSSATYDRILRERLHFTAKTQYRILSGAGLNQRTDASGSIGFLVKLGDYK